jgi:hypothetical protein
MDTTLWDKNSAAATEPQLRDKRRISSFNRSVFLDFANTNGNVSAKVARSHSGFLQNIFRLYIIKTTFELNRYAVGGAIWR